MQQTMSEYVVCINSFLRPLGNASLAANVVSSCDFSKLSESGTEQKFKALGALFALGKFDEFIAIVQQLDFNDLSDDLRNYLLLGFKIVFDPIVTNKSEYFVRLPASALLQLLIAINPKLMLAHKTAKKTVKTDQIISLDYAGKIHRSINGVVFFRDFFYGTGSRKHEFGHRITSALASQGWQVFLTGIDQIMQFSSDVEYDFAMVDIVFDEGPIESLYEKISHLKRFFRKIFIINPDPWDGFHDDNLNMAADIIDYLWGFTSEWSMVLSPAYKGRTLLFPNVGGFDHIVDNGISPPDWNSFSINFTGSVEAFNINRMYWILEIISRNLPVDINVTNAFTDDQLDREASLNLYARKLASTSAALNLTTRKDGAQILTGRSIEIISLRRLLIQESCPPFHYYFNKGEHFLEFSDIEELSAIIEFLSAHPAVGKNISLQAWQFYQERYSCKKMVEHIQTYL